jgi:hypothetical protein
MNQDDSSSKVVKFSRKGRRRGRTAEEFMRELEQDPEYMARKAEHDRRHRAKVEENMRAAAPLKADLAKAGVHVSSTSELLYYHLKDIPAAIPVLLRWLPRMENLDIKEGIVRALTDKAVRPFAAPALIEEFREAPLTDEPRIQYLKSAIANALSVVATDLVFDEIAELAWDRRHGWSRALLCTALQRMKNPEAEDVLMRVLEGERGETEPAVARFAVRALGNRKSVRAKALIEEFLDYPDPERLVGKEAERSLDKIARAEQKARERRRSDKKA